MSTHRVAIDQQKAIGASGRRGERLLPSDLTNLLLHRDGIADDARSVGAVVAVVAGDVSHRLPVGVLTLPANRLRWPDRQRPPTTLPQRCRVVRRPRGDTMAAGGPAKALHRTLALAQEGLAGLGSDADPERSGDRTYRRASGPAGCCWGNSRQRGRTRPRAALLNPVHKVLAEGPEAPRPAPASSARVGSVAEELARTGR